MERTRRVVLRALATVPLLRAMPTLASPIDVAPINVVGYGSCGGGIVRWLAAQRRCVLSTDFVAVDDPDVTPVHAPHNVVGEVTEYHEGRPLVVVTEVSSSAGGEHALRMTMARSDVWGTPVVPVLVLPSKWEGSRRQQGLVLAERFIELFGPGLLIDKQVMCNNVQTDRGEASLHDLYARIGCRAMARIERVVTKTRDG